MTFTKIMQRVGLSLATLVSSVWMLVGASGTAAAADCHSFTANLAYVNFDVPYVYSSKYTVPSWSTCHDINATTFTSWDGTITYCRNVRVRFYPSSGGSYTNSWKNICHGSTLKPIATNVANGTVYRIESYGNELAKMGIYD